jgi:hypothetical protein
MTLPAPFVNEIETHLCLSGCYESEQPTYVCLDPNKPLEKVICVSCHDCLMHHVGALASTLAAGMDGYALAREASAHVRSLRGYKWSVSGYHTAGGGFWLTAMSYGNGILLVDGSRHSKTKQTDLDLLIHAFTHKVCTPEDPRMTDPALYAVETVFLRMDKPILPVTCKNDILSSSQCNRIQASGYRRATLCEFLPLQQHAHTPVLAISSTAHSTAKAAQPHTTPLAVSGAPVTAAVSTPAAPKKASKPLQLGDICPVCHDEVRERLLFTSTFVGCKCG